MTRGVRAKRKGTVYCLLLAGALGVTVAQEAGRVAPAEKRAERLEADLAEAEQHVEEAQQRGAALRRKIAEAERAVIVETV